MTDKKETTVRLITTVAKVIIFFVGWAMLASVIPIPDSSNPAVWRFFAELIPFFCIAAMTALFFVIERRKITLHMTAKPLHTIVLSCVLGVVWIGVAVGILTILGVVRIAGVNQIEALWLWMLSAFV
ncbi:MAG: CPBP family intramembrane metalloprotease, partial [Eubacteriales bacterium]|nr:CPBP family intramembrane metalloprotease [Eubacteriales bacterium]